MTLTQTELISTLLEYQRATGAKKLMMLNIRTEKHQTHDFQEFTEQLQNEANELAEDGAKAIYEVTGWSKRNDTLRCYYIVTTQTAS